MKKKRVRKKLKYDHRRPKPAKKKAQYSLMTRKWCVIGRFSKYVESVIHTGSPSAKALEYETLDILYCLLYTQYIQNYS